tara:strand:- start:18 stop:713 length:696 start_codon:yes stop_codon:yes gene_type:complete
LETGVKLIREKKQTSIMGLDARQKLNAIADEVGGFEELREKLRLSGILDWETAEFYPIISWFPDYMDEPDVIGIAVRNGYSFFILYGRTNTPHDRVNSWYDYVSMYDEYESITEALLDHHKAIIATEVDYADNRSGKSWTAIVQEVIDGIRPTKFDINDDDFLLNSIDSINFSDTEHWLSEHESFRVLFNALKNLGLDLNTNTTGMPIDTEEITIEMSEDYFDDDFRDKWA